MVSSTEQNWTWIYTLPPLPTSNLPSTGSLPGSIRHQNCQGEIQDGELFAPLVASGLSAAAAWRLGTRGEENLISLLLLKLDHPCKQ